MRKAERNFSVFFYILTIISGNCFAEKLTLENIFREGIYYPERIEAKPYEAKDGYFTYLQNYCNIIECSYSDSNYQKIIISCFDTFKINLPYILEYQQSAGGKFFLISTNAERLYRYSYFSEYYVWDFSNKKLIPVNNGNKLRYAELSPDNNYVAFIHENNIYIQNIKTGIIEQVTADGMINKIINGIPDWLYEEEFYLLKGIEWSPDGKSLAYYRFDESNVPEMNLINYNNLYPAVNTFKYPKAGEVNSEVNIFIYSIENKTAVKINTGDEKDVYIPRIKWTNDINVLSIIRINRAQNKLELLLANLHSNDSKVIYKDITDTYISDVTGDYVWFTSENKYFIICSEKEGYNQIYLFNTEGKLINKLTKEDYDIYEIYGIDNDNKLFYSAYDKDPVNLGLFEMDLKTGEKQKISRYDGWNEAIIDLNNNYLILENSTATIPNRYFICDKNGEKEWMLFNNHTIINKQKIYNYTSKDFQTFKINGNILNGYIMKPLNFDNRKKYPVLIFVYGGPGSQEVVNKWDGVREEWFQYLNQLGYLVACIDNRGTGGRGVKFRKCTYKKLGELETEDQVSFAKHLGNIPYIDKERIGIFGWSNGGYIALLCLEKGASVYKTGISVAPITHWKYYDSGYTERYMKKPDENPENYEKSSVLSYTDKIKDIFLLVHGTYDDNVHFQHSAELIKALIESNKQFELMVYPDSDHSIVKGNATFHLYNAMTNFLIKNL